MMFKMIASKMSNFARVMRVHLCTLAVAMSLNAWWRVPHAGFRYGGVAYGLALTVATVAVAAPAALLQLSLGQLCQQGVLGIWKAVPFFTGVGYLRLLISSLSSIYTIIHLALLTTNFFYTLRNQDPFGECTELDVPVEFNEASVINSSLLCYTESLMAPVGEEPGYYTAVALLIISFWIVIPFLLYNPVKFLKRIFYVLGPSVLLLGIVIMWSLGVWADLATMLKRSDWPNFLDPDIWHAAVIQALCSTQIAGGFLISSGGVLYSNTDIQWTTLNVMAANIASSWFGLVFWFAVSGNEEKDTSLVAVIYQVYNMAEEKQLGRSWPLLVFFTLTLSGVITMLTLVYPLYERFRAVGGVRWRVLTALSSAVGIAAALAALAGKLAALHLLENIALPLLISITTVLEISAFLFVYGWKILVEDVEFLTDRPLSKYWVMGWCVAPGIIAPFSAWWMAMVVASDAGWREPPYSASTLVATASLTLIVFFTCSGMVVAKQVQYDLFSKIKASFTPSRHWGPRDPITHYYWASRRDDLGRRVGTRSRYNHVHPAPSLQRLGPLPSISSRLSASPDPEQNIYSNPRGHSDDWFYTVYRRQFLNDAGLGLPAHSKRSKSLDSEFFKDNPLDVIKDLHIYSEIIKKSNK